MVKKYKIEVTVQSSYGSYPEVCTELIESNDGKLVKLSTYQDEVARLKKQVAKFKKEALRYRWLRNGGRRMPSWEDDCQAEVGMIDMIMIYDGNDSFSSIDGKDLDKAIDLEMEKEKK